MHADASERGGRLQNGGHKVAKRSLAWPERSECNSVPAYHGHLHLHEARVGGPSVSRLALAASSFSNTHDLENNPRRNRCRNISTKFIGKVGRMDIFAFEEI